MENRLIILVSTLALFTDLLVFILGLLTTITDPSDMTVREERYFRLTKQFFDDNQYEFYCNHCDANVRALSKHCGRCKRCTAHFDHHCIWLNNCIGYNNYRLFFWLLIMVILHSLGIVALGVFRVYIFYLNSKSTTSLAILCYVMVLINGAAAVLIGYLLSYHIWLCIVGKTTYQHILEQRKRMQEREN